MDRLRYIWIPSLVGGGWERNKLDIYGEEDKEREVVGSGWKVELLKAQHIEDILGCSLDGIEKSYRGVGIIRNKPWRGGADRNRIYTGRTINSIKRGVR